MIGRLRGEVIDRTATQVVVDVQGVGYLVTVARNAAFTVGEAVDIHIHTHVREDALVLFGFAQQHERDVFDLLITVPSIGPVKAMGILETPLEELLSAVAHGDIRRLSKLPGIGKRTAERIVVDLRETFAALAPSIAASGEPPVSAAATQLMTDLVSALTHLGFKNSVAEREAGRAVETLGIEAGLDPLLRHCLDQLRKR